MCFCYIVSFNHGQWRSYHIFLYNMFFNNLVHIRLHCLGCQGRGLFFFFFLFLRTGSVFLSFSIFVDFMLQLCILLSSLCFGCICIISNVLYHTFALYSVDFIRLFHLWSPIFLLLFPWDEIIFAYVTRVSLYLFCPIVTFQIRCCDCWIVFYPKTHYRKSITLWIADVRANCIPYLYQRSIINVAIRCIHVLLRFLYFGR